MTIMITGFEPFGAFPVNASALVVSRVQACRLAGVVTAVLPTSYRRAGQSMEELLDLHRPHTVLMLGLARHLECLRFEEMALNLDDRDAPDNDGEVRIGQPVVPDAPPVYMNTLPLDRMTSLAREQGEEVQFSRDAGGYVCNHAFYCAAHLIATHYPGSRCGFVHIPPWQATDTGIDRFVDLVQRWIDLFRDS